MNSNDYSEYWRSIKQQPSYSSKIELMESLFQFEDTTWIYYLKVAFTVLLLCKIVAKWQQSNITLHFNPKNQFMAGFVETSRVRELKFTPWLFALYPAAQSIAYLILETCHQKFGKHKFTRELFTLADGGTMGIDWYNQKKQNTLIQPILLLFPGLSGGTNNLYTHTLAKAALRKGFNCGVVLFRCAEDIPITSCKLTCAASGDDVTEAIEYVYNKYIKDAQTKEIRTRLYAYGTSLGGILVGLHLQKHGINAKVDGALLYCPPYDCNIGHNYFYNNFFGAYSYVLGMFLNQNLLRSALPHLRKYTTKEEGQRMELVFSTNKTGLRTLDEEIFAPMFGYKSAHEYYKGITLAGKFHQIKVPTFSLHTLDDQVCPAELSPIKEAQAPDSNLIIGSTTHGTHVCHVAGNLLPRQWYQEPFIEFLTYLEHQNKQKRD